MKITLPDKIDTMFVNCNLATMKDAMDAHIEQAALAVSGKQVAWIGKQTDLPAGVETRCRTTVDCNNGWILPGFVDCHTHLVWGGSRSDEFEMRLKGGDL